MGGANTVLVATYLALLRHPHDEWRMQNQAVYVAVLEEIAREAGRTPQYIQDLMEAIARGMG